MNPSHPHDRLVKLAFGRPSGARALLALALPEELRVRLDLESVEIAGGNFIGSRLRESFADLVFSVRLLRRETLVHVLLEHKSAPDRFVVLDLFESCGRIWRDWRRKHPAATRVPRIVPLVLFHGPRPWALPRTLADVLDGDAGEVPALAALEPRLPILLVDLAERSDEELDAPARIDAFAAAALWMLRWSRAFDFLSRILEHSELLRRVLESRDGESGFRQLLEYAVVVAERTLAPDDFAARLAERLPRHAEGLMTTLAEEWIARGLDRGRAEGRAEGRDEGRLRGQRDSIRRVLEARFGTASPDLLAALESIADPAVLDRWLAAAATAPSLAAVARALDRT